MTITKVIRCSALVVLTFSACSWSMHEVSSPLPHGRPIVCSDDVGTPVLDVVGAVFSVTSSLLALSAGAHGDPGLAAGIATVSIGGGVLYSISAVHGFRVARRCRSAREELATRDAREREYERDRQARWLIDTALQAAGTGDCATALGLAQTIRWLRPELHDQVFVHQTVIVKCLVEVTQPVPP